jgi:uncharacterized protein DUF4440
MEMRCWRNSSVVVILCAALLPVAIWSAAGGGDPANSAADREFAQAVAKADKAALGKLLDGDFMWIDANGKTLHRAEVLSTVPKPGINDESGAQLMRYDYGEVATFQVHSGKMHVLRVWVKRPAGWRALVYQEVQSLDAPLAVTPGAGKICENPCKSVQYTPKTETEKAVITSYMGLESAAVAHDAAGWDAHTAEEFMAASSNSDKLLDKPTRMAELKRANMAGVAPTPLASARLLAFGDAVVMTSRHVPDRGKPLQITRVWVRRNGKWAETLSYQTSIQAESAASAQ